VTELVQHIVNGLSLGAIYALIALGYTMVYGILQFINFAHSEIFMLGAYIGYYTGNAMNLDNKPSIMGFFATLFISMLGTAIIGFLVEFLAYRPLRKAARINVLITSVGVSFLFQFGAQMLFGANPRPFPALIDLHQSFTIGNVQIDTIQIIVITVTILLMLLLDFILFGTKMGKAMRAVSHDHNVAKLLGINVNFIIGLTFMIGSALAGAAGILVGMSYPKIEPLMGLMLGLKAFVAAVLGGIGNMRGAVAGGLLMGLAEQLVVSYTIPTFRDALAFAILILILIFKPTGLFGKTVTEKV